MGDEDDVVEMRKDKEMAAIGNWMKWCGNLDLAIHDQFAHCLSATITPFCDNRRQVVGSSINWWMAWTT